MALQATISRQDLLCFFWNFIFSVSRFLCVPVVNPVLVFCRT